jgi:hypothetical protein
MKRMVSFRQTLNFNQSNKVDSFSKPESYFQLAIFLQVGQ